ncbi:MAG: peptidylprolyl isomerase [Patescibacteria group bacterium]
MKKLFLIFPLVALAIVLAGCGAQQVATDSTGAAPGIIEKNPADDTAIGDLNPADDIKINSSSPTNATGGGDLGPADPNSDHALNTNSTTMPTTIIDKAKSYTAVLKTDQGTIEIALNTKDTPITANNFVWLAKKNFYDNTVFHRVIKGFMIQGGDPRGDGTGGPGYKFNDEAFTGEYTRGTVAMANAGPNTNGSQFFILQADYPLPKSYVIFGHVTKGLDVVDKIANAPTVIGADGALSKPVLPVVVKSVTIIEK